MRWRQRRTEESGKLFNLDKHLKVVASPILHMGGVNAHGTPLTPPSPSIWKSKCTIRQLAEWSKRMTAVHEVVGSNPTLVTFFWRLEICASWVRVRMHASPSNFKKNIRSRLQPLHCDSTRLSHLFHDSDSTRLSHSSTDPTTLEAEN